MAYICGGWSEPKVATEDTQKMCDQVKDQVNKTGQNYLVFKAVLYRDQVVAGENFLIKVFAGEEDYLHLFVFRALPCNGGRIVLEGVQQHKTKEDPLVPFDSVKKAQIIGVWSKTKVATEDTQEIWDQVKEQVEEMTVTTSSRFLLEKRTTST